MATTTLGETWIEDESRAYGTPTGAPSGSARKGLVRFPDGKLRIVRLGVPDTYSTIPARPAHGRIGYVFVEKREDGGQEFTFQPPSTG